MISHLLFSIRHEHLPINFSEHKKLFYALGLMGIFIGYMAIIQFSTPDMPDNDGFYHIKMAYLMRTQGLKPDFPWLPLTILNPQEFYDHHFLFHVALIPFTFGDLRLGAKTASVVFSSLAFLSVWALFYKRKIIYSGLWAIGLLAVSEAFIFRMSITRAQSISLAFLVIGFSWLITGKYSRLIVLGFLYVWTYDAFILLPVMALLYTLSILLLEGRLEYRPLLCSVAGVILGLVINPYFPNDLIFIYRHLIPKLVETTAVNVGIEWYPYTTLQLLENSALTLIAFLIGVVALGLKRDKMDVPTSLALFTVFLFAGMLFQARRFIEYFPAFVLIFTAFACNPMIRRWELRPSDQLVSNPGQTILRTSILPSGLREHFIGVIIIFIIIPGMFLSNQRARADIRQSKAYDLYSDAAAWLQENTSPGERVFQTDWDDFPRLFFYDTSNTYLVGLDPTFLQLYNARLYSTWVAITRGEVEQPSRLIYNDFGAKYIFSDLNHNSFLDRAAKDPYLIEEYRDNQAVIFRVVY
jgi:hypothetical protein